MRPFTFITHMWACAHELLIIIILHLKNPVEKELQWKKKQQHETKRNATIAKGRKKPTTNCEKKAGGRMLKRSFCCSRSFFFAPLVRICEIFAVLSCVLFLTVLPVTALLPLRFLLSFSLFYLSFEFSSLVVFAVGLKCDFVHHCQHLTPGIVVLIVWVRPTNSNARILIHAKNNCRRATDKKKRAIHHQRVRLFAQCSLFSSRKKTEDKEFI